MCFDSESSSSQTSQATTTTNTDARLAVGERGQGISAPSSRDVMTTTSTTITAPSSTTLQTIDAGAVAAAATIANRALEASESANAIQGQGLNSVLQFSSANLAQAVKFARENSESSSDLVTRVLNTGLSLFSAGFNTIDKSQTGLDKAQAQVAAAYDSANTLAKTADNRYLVATGMAVIAMVGIMAFAWQKQRAGA